MVVPPLPPLTITEPDEIFITGSADVAITYGLSTTLTAETNTLDLTGVTWAPTAAYWAAKMTLALSIPSHP